MRGAAGLSAAKRRRASNSTSNIINSNSNTENRPTFDIEKAPPISQVLYKHQQRHISTSNTIQTLANAINQMQNNMNVLHAEFAELKTELDLLKTTKNCTAKKKAKGSSGSKLCIGLE